MNTSTNRLDTLTVLAFAVSRIRSYIVCIPIMAPNVISRMLTVGFPLPAMAYIPRLGFHFAEL